jgi:hypothetical protein
MSLKSKFRMKPVAVGFLKNSFGLKGAFALIADAHVHIS